MNPKNPAPQLNKLSIAGIVIALAAISYLILNFSQFRKGNVALEKQQVLCEQIIKSDSITPGDMRYLPPDLASLPPETHVCGTNTIQGLTYFSTKLSETDIFAHYEILLKKMGCSILGQATPDVNSKISNSLNFRCENGLGYILTYRDEAKYAILFKTTTN